MFWDSALTWLDHLTGGIGIITYVPTLLTQIVASLPSIFGIVVSFLFSALIIRWVSKLL